MTGPKNAAPSSKVEAMHPPTVRRGSTFLDLILSACRLCGGGEDDEEPSCGYKKKSEVLLKWMASKTNVGPVATACRKMHYIVLIQGFQLALAGWKLWDSNPSFVGLYLLTNEPTYLLPNDLLALSRRQLICSYFATKTGLCKISIHSSWLDLNLSRIVCASPFSTTWEVKTRNRFLGECIKLFHYLAKKYSDTQCWPKRLGSDFNPFQSKGPILSPN